MVVQVDGEETIKGKEYYKIVVVVSGIPGWNPTTHYLRYSSQGIFRVSAEHKEKPECLEIPLPLHVGAAWTADCPDGETSYRAEGIETVYLLERKHENCLKITWNREKESMVERGTMYFAPGVGEVRGTLSVGNLTMDYVLEKYRH
ncbi:MAG TPA: hypothetical protein VNJ11_01655 [Bryobacteraceae bacterium]|nr:hypothetical protein [Bryobacteraceae bacterium]